MWETILKVGGEGGGITLRGMMKEGEGWLYTRISDESTLADLLSEVEDDITSLSLVNKSKVVENIEDGLALLNDSWPRLYPRTVHPQFSDLIWHIVSHDDVRDHMLRIWADVCFPDADKAKERYNAAVLSRKHR